jgi:hypothetical protein
VSHSDVDVLIYDILNFGELRTSWKDRNELNGELILANVLFLVIWHSHGDLRVPFLTN